VEAHDQKQGTVLSPWPRFTNQVGRTINTPLSKPSHRFPHLRRPGRRSLPPLPLIRNGSGAVGKRKRLHIHASGSSGMSWSMRSIMEASFPWLWEPLVWTISMPGEHQRSPFLAWRRRTSWPNRNVDDDHRRSSRGPRESRGRVSHPFASTWHARGCRGCGGLAGR
jgi:hypothetical protein